jgi:hypothetical protein
LVHLLRFLQGSIMCLDPMKIGSDLMEMLMELLQIDSSTANAANFVTLSKKDSTSKVVMINALLSTVLAMLEDEDSTGSRKSALDAFTKRVLASLLQARPSLAFRNGSAELDLLHRGRTVYGQLVLVSCQRILDSGDFQTGSKLLPLSMQVVLNLSRPSDEIPDDATVAKTLLVELTKLFRTQLARLREAQAELYKACSHECLLGMELVLQMAYRDTWSVSLKALAVLLQQMTDVDDAAVRTCVESVLNLRSGVAGDKHAEHAIDDAVASLIQGFGIEVFWKWINWNVGSSGEPKSSDSGA